MEVMTLIERIITLFSVIGGSILTYIKIYEYFSSKKKNESSETYDTERVYFPKNTASSKKNQKSEADSEDRWQQLEHIGGIVLSIVIICLGIAWSIISSYVAFNATYNDYKIALWFLIGGAIIGLIFTQSWKGLLLGVPAILFSVLFVFFWGGRRPHLETPSWYIVIAVGLTPVVALLVTSLMNSIFYKLGTIIFSNIITALIGVVSVSIIVWIFQIRIFDLPLANLAGITLILTNIPLIAIVTD